MSRSSSSSSTPSSSASQLADLLGRGALMGEAGERAQLLRPRAAPSPGIITS